MKWNYNKQGGVRGSMIARWYREPDGTVINFGWSGEIRTGFDYPPIPIRKFDWHAVRDGYEPGDPVGYGQTEIEAINDLLATED